MKNKGEAMRILAVLFSLLWLVSCARDYALFYRTHIDGVDDNRSKVSTEKFEFEFYPAYNGIYFTIINLTDKSATLIWDKCYIIEPDGNSYKAVNMDVFSEQKETLIKSNYESIIPPHSKLSRFTTASTNISMFTLDIVNAYRTFSPNSIQSDMVSYSKAVPGDYWKPFITAKPKNLLNNPYTFMLDRNYLGIGFHIIHDGQNLEYTYRLKVHAVEAYEMNKGPRYSGIKKRKFIAMPDSWIWQSVEK